MSKSFAILPCNGLDKCAGAITREIAIQVAEKTDSQIICPVFYRVADIRYNKLAEEMPLLVLDGCATRCASKLAAEKGLAVSERLIISDFAKDKNISLGSELSLSQEAISLVESAVESLLAAPEPMEPILEESENMRESFFPKQLNYKTFQKDKYIFRLPTDEGFYYNENDVWVYVSGKYARVGVTDFVQKSLSDILFFTPPGVGAEIAQFDEMGEIEAGKAVFGIISPVSGRVVSVNESLVASPEMMNENPYEQGWVAEIELSDFEDDLELLHTFNGYFPIMKKKVEEFHV